MKSKEEILEHAFRRLIIRESTRVVIGDAMEEYAQQKLDSYRSQEENQIKKLEEAVKLARDKMADIENDPAWIGSGLRNYCMMVRVEMDKAL